MTQKRRIVICDDEEDATRQWRDELEGVKEVTDSFDIQALSVEVFTEVIAALEQRQSDQRKPASPSTDTSTAEPLDSADILVVDFDLLELRDRGSASATETGERIAYLARCYSTCGYIVALNQFDRGAPVFDLTLTGHVNSFADLNISSKQLANPGLWSDRREGFRPWAWPCLRDADLALARRADVLQERMSDLVLSTLNLSDDLVASKFNREQLSFLSNDDPTEATFDSFVDNSDSGLRGKDQQRDPKIRARIAAARVHKWLERMVLPGQDILIDAPHLAARFPSLVGEPVDDLALWSKLATVCDRVDEDPLELKSGRFDASTWLSRPAWIWPDLQRDDGISEIANPWNERFDEYGFCEDISDFLPRRYCRNFTAEVSSAWNTRYVVDQGQAPLDSSAVAGRYSINKVRYEPSVQFTL